MRAANAEHTLLKGGQFYVTATGSNLNARWQCIHRGRAAL